MRFRDQILKAKEASGLTDYAIARAIGIDQGVLSRFNSGEQGLTMDTLDALAKLLNLHVVAGPLVLPKLLAKGGAMNPDGYRLRCVDNCYEGLISEFPRVGFKQWESIERSRISRERGRKIKLTHYRVDSPEGRKRLTQEQLRQFGLL